MCGIQERDLRAIWKQEISYFDAQEDAVIQIISEEASAYFSGQKGIEDVTGVIQNRVQLYLNENGS